MISEEKQKEIALIAKLTDLEKFCLDATIVSNLKNTEKVMMAYRLSRTKDSKATEQAIYVQARRWYSSPACQAYIKMKEADIIITGKDDEGGWENKTNRTKDELVAMLNRHLSKADRANDSKLVNEITARLSDLQQMKKEQTEQEEKIRIYMPLQCYECQLYLKDKMSH